MYIIMDPMDSTEASNEVSNKRKDVSAKLAYFDLIKDAIVTRKERGGSSRRAINKYVSAKMRTGFKFGVFNRELEAAVKGGKLIYVKDKDSFKLAAAVAAAQCHCPDDFTITKKETCIDEIPDYEPDSIIKALLVENGFLTAQGDVVHQNKESYIISIPPNKALSTNSIMNWLKDSTEPQNLKPITITSVRSSTQDTPSGLSFLDNFLKTSNGSLSFSNTAFAKSCNIPSQTVPETITGIEAEDEEMDNKPKDEEMENKPKYIILITTHGTISQNKTLVPSSYNKNIVKITASTPGTVNYIMPGEVTGWEVEIQNLFLSTRFDTMDTIGENIKDFAKSHSPYYKRARQVHDQFGSDRLSSAIKAWDKCSLISSSDSTTAQDDFQNYYDNAAFGYHSWYIKGKPKAEETEETFYDKTYTNKGLFNDGSPEGLRCQNMKLGLIQICYQDNLGTKPRWKNLEIIKTDSTDDPITFNNEKQDCKLSDILYTIKNTPRYDNVVIIDLTCSVPAKGYLDCLYAQAIQQCLSKGVSEGGSKSKKRKRKSNKTRKRRRKPSRNPRKHKKHQKSKRNPNKRRTKRK